MFNTIIPCGDRQDFFQVAIFVRDQGYCATNSNSDCSDVFVSGSTFIQRAYSQNSKSFSSCGDSLAFPKSGGRCAIGFSTLLSLPPESSTLDLAQGNLCSRAIGCSRSVFLDVFRRILMSPLMHPSSGIWTVARCSLMRGCLITALTRNGFGISRAQMRSGSDVADGSRSGKASLSHVDAALTASGDN